MINRPGLVEHAEAGAFTSRPGWKSLAAKHPDKSKQVRGLGLMLGLALNGPAGPLVNRLDRELGYIVGATQDTVLRFVPPLVVSRDEIDGLISGPGPGPGPEQLNKTRYYEAQHQTSA